MPFSADTLSVVAFLIMAASMAATPIVVLLSLRAMEATGRAGHEDASLSMQALSAAVEAARRDIARVSDGVDTLAESYRDGAHGMASTIASLSAYQSEVAKSVSALKSGNAADTEAVIGAISALEEHRGEVLRAVDSLRESRAHRPAMAIDKADLTPCEEGAAAGPHLHVFSAQAVHEDDTTYSLICLEPGCQRIQTIHRVGVANG